MAMTYPQRGYRTSRARGESFQPPLGYLPGAPTGALALRNAIARALAEEAVAATALEAAASVAARLTPLTALAITGYEIYRYWNPSIAGVSRTGDDVWFAPANYEHHTEIPPWEGVPGNTEVEFPGPWRADTGTPYMLTGALIGYLELPQDNPSYFGFYRERQFFGVGTGQTVARDTWQRLSDYPGQMVPAPAFLPAGSPQYTFQPAWDEPPQLDPDPLAPPYVQGKYRSDTTTELEYATQLETELEMITKTQTQEAPEESKDRWKKPRVRVREKKLKLSLRPGGVVSALVNLVTETADVISSIYSALPPLVRQGWVQDHGKFYDGKWHLTLQEKAHAIWVHHDKIDWNKGIKNVIKRNLNDMFVGGLGKVNAGAHGKLESPNTTQTVLRRTDTEGPSPMGDLVDQIWPVYEHALGIKGPTKPPVVWKGTRPFINNRPAWKNPPGFKKKKRVKKPKKAKEK